MKSTSMRSFLSIGPRGFANLSRPLVWMGEANAPVETGVPAAAAVPADHVRQMFTG
jgi:hypothetical protein